MVTRPPSLKEIETFWQAFEKNFSPPATYQLLGAQLLAFDPHQKSLTARFTATSKMLNPAGNIQGGLLAAFMDDTMGPLGVIMGAGRYFPATTDLHSQYFRPAKPGVFECEARITSMTKTICATSANLYNVREEGARGRLVASAIQTAMLVPFAR